MSSALMENYNVIDAVTSRSREARANAFYLFFKISLKVPRHQTTLLKILHNYKQIHPKEGSISDTIL